MLVCGLGQHAGTTFKRDWRLEKIYNRGYAMRAMAGATTLGDFVGAIGVRTQEAAIVAELKAGSEDAYAWLIGEFHQPVYSLVYRIVADAADAADTTQEVFLKVFRGMKHFHGESSLKTWIYRIAIHEASNRRRWWFRHKAKETSMEPPGARMPRIGPAPAMKDTLRDEGESPFDSVAHEEVRCEWKKNCAKFRSRTAPRLILRDLEEMSYEEIAEITQVSSGDCEVPADPRTRGAQATADRVCAGGRTASWAYWTRRVGRKPERISRFLRKPMEVEVAS